MWMSELPPFVPFFLAALLALLGAGGSARGIPDVLAMLRGESVERAEAAGQSGPPGAQGPSGCGRPRPIPAPGSPAQGSGTPRPLSGVDARWTIKRRPR
mgnify:CR=1 FL=1